MSTAAALTDSADPCSVFSSHQFQFRVQGQLLSAPPITVFALVTQVGEAQLQLWLGTKDAHFNNLAFAIQDRKDPKVVHSSKVYGELISETNPTDDLSQNLSEKLSKKLQKPVFVSYNAPEDPDSVVEIQKQLFKLIKEQPSSF